MLFLGAVACQMAKKNCQKREKDSLRVLGKLALLTDLLASSDPARVIADVAAVSVSSYSLQ